MINIVVKPILLSVSMLLFCGSAIAQSLEFSAKRFDEVKQQHQGKKWMTLMWSLDCPPCFKELAHVASLKKQNPELAVILINTDSDDELTVEREALIEKYGLTDMTNMHFADGKATQSRFSVDPAWHGELPRSYFYQADGKRTGRSGLLSKAALQGWLL